MNYDFSSLSHREFEDLARDVVGREIELRFEAFPEGPDDGMDGRHARADGTIVMQAKHYHGSGFAALKSKMTKERQSIDRLAPTRYILVTSAPLTPKNKTVLAEIIGPSLQTPGKPIKSFGRRTRRFCKPLSRKLSERPLRNQDRSRPCSPILCRRRQSRAPPQPLQKRCETRSF
jgi:Restriction endonuclease